MTRRCSLLVLAALVTIVAAGAAIAKDVYVAPWGVDFGPNTGLSLADPFRTVSFALNGASGVPLAGGDRILVLPGLYDTAAGEIFPLQLPVGVSLVGVGGASVTTIAAPGAWVNCVQVFGKNSPDTQVTGIMFTGSFLLGGAIQVSGGPGYLWPTSPPLPAPATGPGIAAPTIADNILTQNAHGLWVYANFGPTAARVERNILFGNQNGDVACLAFFNYELSVFDNNIFGPARAGIYFVGYGGPYPVFPLFRSNVVYGCYAGSWQVPFYSVTYAVQINATTVGNGYGLIDRNFPYYGYDAFIDSIVYYNTYADVYTANAIGMWFTDYGASAGPGSLFGLGSIRVPPALGGAGFALTAASPCIDQGAHNLFGAHVLTGETHYSSHDVYGDPRIVNVIGIPSAYYGTDVAEIDMGADEFVPGQNCLDGTVNTGTGAPCTGTGAGPVDTMFVNGSSGGSGRTVVVSSSDVIAVSLTVPPAGAPLPANYIVNGWAGAPPGAAGIAWPKGVGMGCFPIFPATFVANTAKPFLAPSTPEATGCTQPCVVFDIPPGLPIGSIWTFQGITTDNGGPGKGAQGTVCAGITNGVVAVVGP